MKFLGFVGPTYNLQSVNVDCQRCVNMYVEAIESGTGKGGESAFLKSTPGLKKVLDALVGPLRLLHVDSEGTIFAVTGNTLRRLVYNSGTDVWTSVVQGTLLTTTGPVTAASGQFSTNWVTVFADGNTTYLYYRTTFGTPGMYFGSYASFGFPPVDKATHVVFIDGYFVFSSAGSNQFFVTSWNDILVDPLSFASAEGDPDNIVAIIANNRNLILFGERSTEVFTDTGNADFPFERAGGGFLEKGCAAAYSVAKIDGAVAWLGRDSAGQGIVYAATSLSPQRISTHAVESAIASYANIHTATAFTYQSEGHSFYVLNFAENTWVYDFSTKMWHERCYTNAGELERHRADVHCFIPQYDLHLVGDYADGRIYELDNDFNYDDASNITRMRVTPHVSSSLKKVFCSQIQIDMQVGVGSSTGPGFNPQLVMDYSDDGGYTWSSESYGAIGSTIGGIGEFKTRVIFRRLGSFRDRVFRFKMTDPVKCTILGAEIDIAPGIS